MERGSYSPSRLFRPDELHLRLHPHLVRYQHPAGLDHLVPLEPPVPPVDLGPGAEAGAFLPPRVPPPPLEGAVEGHLNGGAVDGQVPGDLEPVPLPLEIAAQVPALEG